ncbi:MAG: TonB-dependent receptor plug domain-containing protein [Alistipes sp.]|nr:TonB-dependent receptor plug domain-containing protein [Alistipes sp.]
MEKQTDYSVNYNETKLDDSKQLELSLVNQPLDETMKAILGGTGFGYQVRNGYIIIVPERQDAPQDANVITGRITDEEGLPLVGVAVTIPGTATGTSTNQTGSFSITAAPGSTLSISYLGYHNQTIRVTNQKVYNIVMEAQLQDIDVVVVTAMGIKRAQKALSYNVQEINADEITRVKDANFINSLSGKVAGVTINASSSGIGGATKVVMRGVKNIEQSSNALYVIDGIPMYNMAGEGSTEFGSIGETEGIADLNPKDIETMSVLTGASAAALYGSRGANGAIIITTKKGGKPTS